MFIIDITQLILLLGHNKGQYGSDHLEDLDTDGCSHGSQ